MPMPMPIQAAKRNGTTGYWLVCALVALFSQGVTLAATRPLSLTWGNTVLQYTPGQWHAGQGISCGPSSSARHTYYGSFTLTRRE